MINYYKNTIFDLSEKAAIVTGGGSGLGRAMAKALAIAGANIVIADINEASGNAVRDEIKKMGAECIFIETDVSKKSDVERMVKKTVKEFNSLDIAVNNAGVIGENLKILAKLESFEPLEAQNFTEEDIRKNIDVLFIGVLFCCQEEGKQMIKQKKGRIINMASMCATTVIREFPGQALYSGIKAAVKHMSKALAVDWVKYNITVNSISPGNMITPPAEKALNAPKIKKIVLDICPMNRIGNPSELDGAIIYLASDASSFVAGHDFVIDGGTSI